jgi:hypothetical protein
MVLSFLGRSDAFAQSVISILVRWTSNAGLGANRYNKTPHQEDSDSGCDPS